MSKKLNKILFITKRFVIEPLGIGYLSAGLKQKGFEVDLLQIDKDTDYIGYVKTHTPDIICYQIWTGGQKCFYNINKCLKQNYRFISIFGGAHATFCTDDVMSQPHIDYVIKGEGDYALPELCEHLRNENVFSMGIEYVSCNKAGLVNAKLPPQKLDELPDPDRDILYKYEHNKNNPIRSISSSRGCPFACTFCFNSQFNEIFDGKRLRQREIWRVINEATKIKEDYPETKFFFFQDDEMGASKKNLEILADFWPFHVGVPFHVQMRIEYIDYDRIRLLQKAGCNSITFALESADGKVRKEILGKKFSQEKVDKAIDILHELKMPFRMENMIGIPFCNTIEDMWNTFEFNKKSKTGLSWASLCQPYPSTELGNRCIKSGVFDGDISTIPDAFFGKTVLLFDKKTARKLENMQRLFTLLVGLKVPKWMASILLLLPFDRLYERVGKLYKEHLFKRLYKL